MGDLQAVVPTWEKLKRSKVYMKARKTNMDFLRGPTFGYLPGGLGPCSQVAWCDEVNKEAIAQIRPVSSVPVGSSQGERPNGDVADAHTSTAVYRIGATHSHRGGGGGICGRHWEGAIARSQPAPAGGTRWELVDGLHNDLAGVRGGDGSGPLTRPPGWDTIKTKRGGGYCQGETTIRNQSRHHPQVLHKEVGDLGINSVANGCVRTVVVGLTKM